VLFFIVAWQRIYNFNLVTHSA